MGRRPLGEGKSLRLQMMISPSDLAEIKEWQHAHQFQSLSEAIRWLVFEGIIAERNRKQRSFTDARRRHLAKQRSEAAEQFRKAMRAAGS